jgi:hypothetical protein
LPSTASGRSVLGVMLVIEGMAIWLRQRKKPWGSIPQVLQIDRDYRAT